MGKVAAIRLIELYIIVLIICIAGITILGAYTAYFDPRNYNIIPYIGLVLPFLLICDIIGSIYLLVIRKFILAIFVSISFFIGFDGAGYNLNNIIKAASSSQSKDIRIMTFNIGENQSNRDDPENLKNISQFIEDENIDIVCIQEYPTDKETDDSLKDYLSFMPFQTFIGNNSEYLRVAIFSRFPILSVKPFLFKGSNNSAISANLSINDKIIKLICAHLQTTNFNQTLRYSKYKISYQAISKMNENRMIRADQTDIIKEEIRTSDLPLIFCGDMNDPPASYTYKQIKQCLTDGFNDCGKGIGYTYRGFFRLLRIDYILYSKDFKGVRYKSPNKPYSDHNPVIMDLSLN